MTVEQNLNLARRIECEEDGLYFNRFFFKQRFGGKMIINRHHQIVQSVLDRTMLPPSHKDFISRLIINIPPGYSKTEIASIGYMARGLAINPMSRFLHLSYSDSLVLLNSSIVRETVKSRKFQDMWSVEVKTDTDSKKIWHTTVNGGVTATAAGGQVTGFRAGHMDDIKFTGALIIDDPVKPDDANSETIRGKVNQSFNETVASRVAIETVPIIVIMQRIHWDDLSGYLLRGGSGEKWHHLCLPVKISNDDEYPKEYTHGIPLSHGLDGGWLWPFKHNDKHEAALRSHRRRKAAQYDQKPIKRDEEKALWTEKIINIARLWVESEPERTLVSIDPAVTNTKTSDEHGIIVGSKLDDKLYGIIADYTCKGSPKNWADTAIDAYEKHEAAAIVIETNQGGDMCEDTLRHAGFQGRVIRVHASKGKTARAEPIAALYELGYVRHKPGLSLLEDEMLDFDPLTGLSNGISPNRVDAVVWLLSELSGGIELEELLKMALNG
jgi:phage terminase large subunit-like protein